MYACIIKMESVTASFRNPDFQNFHKSFTLPPPTTLVGILGAALGLSPKEVQSYCEENQIYLGVNGTSQSLSRDLWKHINFNEKSDGRGIITREILFKNKFIFVFASNEKSVIEKIKTAFHSPVYALTFGTSDSLAKVSHDIELVHDLVEHNTISNTLIEGDIVSMLLNQMYLGGSFAFSLSSKEPIGFNIPTRFMYEADNEVRKVSARRFFSFVGSKVELADKKFQGFWTKDKQTFIPIFPF